ncbi:MAG: hypothetical protein ABIA37_02720 [Candidatus Woesearchaeota archaeon]
MRWKTLFLVLVLSIASVWTVWADSDITVEPIKNSIILTETASYKLTITNNAQEKQRYSLFSFVLGWDIEPNPLKDKIIEILPGQNKSTTIQVKPKEGFNPGVYGLELNIESDLGEKYTEKLNVYINPDKPLDYLPSVKVTVDLNEKMDPQKIQSIKLYLENKNPLNISELVIRLESDLPEFNEKTTISLAPLSKKNVEFTITPNPQQKPDQYTLFFVFEKGGETIKVVNQPIEILPVTALFDLDLTEQKAFLKKSYSLDVTNLGNIKDTQNVTLPVTLWQGMFTSSEAKVVKIDDKRYLSWETTLNSNESQTLTAVQNYRYPFYFLIALIIFGLFYLITKSPIGIKKTSVSTHAEDSTLSELKVTLHLKNYSKKSLKEIEVVDLIPGIADIEKSLDLGTLKPLEIKHTKKGTLVKWKLAEIESHEDRLITYKIRSKLKILGALKLPRAKVIYGPKGKSAYSNTYRISS